MPVINKKSACQSSKIRKIKHSNKEATMKKSTLLVLTCLILTYPACKIGELVVDKTFNSIGDSYIESIKKDSNNKVKE